MTTTKEQLHDLSERIRSAAGNDLVSLVLYGSAAGEDSADSYSDVNLLCVVRDASSPLLDRLGPVMDWWSKQLGHRPVLVLSSDELRESADVFAIETLDLQAHHRVLLGSDVLTGLVIPTNLHRVQVEHDLRTLILRLRQHYLLFRDNPSELEKALAKSTSAVVTLLRHSLLAIGHHDVPLPKRAAVERTAEVLRVDMGPVLAALDQREGRRAQTSIPQLYGSYVDTLGAVVRLIDSVAPKADWRRVGLSR